MELKKNPAVDIYRFRNVFLNLGLMVSISLVFAVFQYKSFDSIGAVDLGEVKQKTNEIMEIPPTTQPPPPPPKIQLPEIIEVANEELVIEDLELNIDIEMNQDTKIVQLNFEDDLDADQPEEEADKIFMIVEQAAEPVGGVKAFYAYVASQLADNYPATAARMNIDGVVYIQFVVEKDGDITQVEAVKGIGGGCDELAVMVVENSPDWVPAKQRGRAVRSRKVIPIRFILKRK
ncbi:energy transducer TonB [uncultured Marivirga sp.]|uniref:energy transducer TonB n=1 Tax=uncultured Marivirga sp. TaxID=1123707 RepID=UPI0030EBC6A0|tara:strand:- start:47571 stop:48269 length:699 start_codon:yes stop_codon:yes gene_type:complete